MLVLKKKRDAERLVANTSLTRNASRRACDARAVEREMKRKNKFTAMPLIIRMQRDWKTYLSMNSQKREMIEAIKLLKRMREDRKAGQEFFRKLKQSNRDQIGTAVDYNLRKRFKYIVQSYQAWLLYTLDRRRRKARLHDKVQRRMSSILCIWFKETMQEKRLLVNQLRPNLFPPLLGIYMRFIKDNDWVSFLSTLSSTFTEFDVGTIVREY